MNGRALMQGSFSRSSLCVSLPGSGLGVGRLNHLTTFRAGQVTMVPSHQEAKILHSSQWSYGDCWLSLETQHRIPTKSHRRRLMPTSAEGGLPALGVT